MVVLDKNVHTIKGARTRNIVMSRDMNDMDMNDIVVPYVVPYDDNDLTTFLNNFDTTVVVDEKEIELSTKILAPPPPPPKRKKNSKRIRRLKKEIDIISKELLTLRVQFDDLKEFLEKESKRRDSTLKSDLREVKTILKELKGTSSSLLSFHHGPTTSNK